MGSQTYKYSYYFFVEYFVLVIIKQYDQSSLLNYKDNYRRKYTKTFS